MTDPKSRARVSRLISGDFRPDDLMGLFLFARDHCDGRESVTDIGDFIAHHNERDRGIVTRSTRDWCTVARYYASRFGPQGALPFDTQRMPSVTRDYFKIAMNRIDVRFIAEKTGGMRKTKAHDLMLRLTERLRQNADGTWALPHDLTSQEFKLVECASSMMVVKPAFEPKRLCEDFLATLKSNGLITKEEINTHKTDLEIAVQLFAVATMHNSVIQIGDGTTVQLKGRPQSRQIVVNAPIANAIPNQPSIFMSCAMFTAGLDATVYCHPDLQPFQDWDFEIELAPDKRLCRL
jgi:hypothetical protein